MTTRRKVVVWDETLQFWRATWTNLDGSSGYRFFSGARFSRAEAVHLTYEAVKEADDHYYSTYNTPINTVPINWNPVIADTRKVSVLPGTAEKPRRVKKCAVVRVFDISAENAFINETKFFNLLSHVFFF